MTRQTKEMRKGLTPAAMPMPMPLPSPRNTSGFALGTIIRRSPACRAKEDNPFHLSIGLGTLLPGIAGLLSV